MKKLVSLVLMFTMATFIAVGCAKSSAPAKKADDKGGKPAATEPAKDAKPADAK